MTAYIYIWNRFVFALDEPHYIVILKVEHFNIFVKH